MSLEKFQRIFEELGDKPINKLIVIISVLLNVFLEDYKEKIKDVADINMEEFMDRQIEWRGDTNSS